MAATPTADELRKLSYLQLSVLPQAYPGIEATSDYQMVFQERAPAGVSPNPAGIANSDQVLDSAMKTLGKELPPEVATKRAKNTEVEAKGKQLAKDVAAGKAPTYAQTKDPAVTAAGRKEAAKGGDDILAGYDLALSPGNVPEWMKAAAGGLDKREKQKVVDTYNRMSFDQVKDFDEFLLKNPEPNEMAKGVLAFSGLIDAQSSHTFNLPGGGQYTIPQIQLREVFGGKFGKDKVSTVQDALNLASQFGINNAGNGQPAWQLVLALERAGRWKQAGKIDKEVGPANPLFPGADAKVPGRSVLTGAYSASGDEDTNAKVDRWMGTFAKTTPGNAATRKAQAGQAAGANINKWMMAAQLSAAYIATGGNNTLAYLKVMNPELYPHLVQNGKINPDSVNAAIAGQQLLLDGGWDEMESFGMATDDDTLRQLSSYVDKSGAGGGSSIMLPDPLKVEQSMKDLYNAWFGLDPSSAEYSTFKDDLYAKLRGSLPAAGATERNEIDPAAQLRNFAEQSANYGALFKAKPVGLSADDYVNTNRQAVGSMLGSDLDPASVRAGQLTGDTQTAIGAAAGSAKAQNNSTFRERLARAAQMVSQNT